MAINLSKGGRFNLQKEAPQIDRIIVGLGWDPNENASQHPFDLDASVFVLGENGKLLSDDYFIFYNQKSCPEGAVQHNGDNRTGAGDGDDETISIQLSKINPNATQILFAITIDQAKERNQDFSMVENSFARVYNADNNEILCQYTLNDTFPNMNALLIGCFNKVDGKWSFMAMENAYDFGLAGLIEFYQ